MFSVAVENVKQNPTFLAQLKKLFCSDDDEEVQLFLIVLWKSITTWVAVSILETFKETIIFKRLKLAVKK